ncbi:MAG TPA: TonB family protein [Pyrinomonadaceae bacterium]|jgi:TonB family protein|nr:TonB family protein [Pyrinomonadaceae bacterium]
MRRRKKASAIFISLIILFLMPDALSAMQKRGAREDIPSLTKPKRPQPAAGASTESGKRRPARKPTTTPALLADLTLNVTPSDARIWLNDQETEYREQDGSLSLRGLKPGSFTIIARKPNYRDYSRTIILEPKQSEFISIVLTPLPAHLNITPSINGTAITLTNKENNTSVSYTEKVSNLEVPAGNYQIRVTRTGYKDMVRNVGFQPAETLSLEPQLELLPVEKPALRRVSAMSLQSHNEGKNIVVKLTGASGDASGGVGTIEVSLFDGSYEAGIVLGALPGVPCQVDFVRLENVGEYSFSEPPASSNGWARVVVRLRPKNSKRPVRFAINWSSLRASLITGDGTSNASLTEDAVPVQKILPNYPPAARTSRIAGAVFVKVEIDEQGNVISAQAIEGPNLLRAAAENAARQWKFRPAKRDGRSARAIQTLQFNFNPEF